MNRDLRDSRTLRARAAALLLTVAALPMQSAGAQQIAHSRIHVDGEPGTARTEALLSLLRSRFTRVTVDAPGWDGTTVIDHARPLDIEHRAYPSSTVAVAIGAAIPNVTAARHLLSPPAVRPVFGPTEVPVRDGAPRRGPVLDERVFAGGHAVLAFALEDAPDVRIALRARDESGRPLALVWHQRRHVFFGPGADVDAMPEEWRAALLGAVAFARSVVSIDAYSPPAPYAGVRRELEWWLARDDPDLDRCRALVADDPAQRLADAAAWRSWVAANAAALAGREDGRLAIHPDLVESGRDPRDVRMLDDAIALLSHEDASRRAMGRGLLARFTAGLGPYASAAEWREWRRSGITWIETDERWHRRGGKRLSYGDSTLAAAYAYTADARVAARVAPDRDPARLKAPYVWAVPPLDAATRLANWLRTTPDAIEQDLALANLAELGRDAGPAARDVAQWFERTRARAGLVARILAAADPHPTPAFVAVLGPQPRPDPRDPRDASRAQRLSLDQQLAIELLVTHPHADARSRAAVLEVAADCAERGEDLLAQAFLAALASTNTTSDETWAPPLDRLVLAARPGVQPEYEATLVKVLALFEAESWVEAVVRRAADEDLDGARKWALLGGLARLGPAGVARLRAVAHGLSTADRVALAQQVDPAAAARHRPPSEWFEDPVSADIAAIALARRTLDADWRAALVAAAHGAEERIAVTAIAALGRARRADGVAEALTAVLAHPSRWRRRAAIHALVSFHRDGPLERVFLAATDDEDADVRLAALWALREGGPADALVEDRLRAAAGRGDAAALVARHSLFRRTLPADARIAAVRALPNPIRLGVSDDDLDSDDRAIRWNTALRLARETADRDWDAELRGRVEHELGKWLDDVWVRLDWGMRGVEAVTFARLGETSLLELERVAPYDWRGSAFAFEGHMALAWALPDDLAWTIYAALMWRVEANLPIQSLAWPDAVERPELVAPVAAMRLAHETCAGPLAGQSVQLAIDGARLWRSLGHAGREALEDLRSHPDERVVAVATKLLEELAGD